MKEPMLKKFKPSDESNLFHPGARVFVVARDGRILEGYQVARKLVDLVELDRSPLEEMETGRGCQNAKHQASSVSRGHGFTITGNQLKPNWCEGKRLLLGACLTRQEAEILAANRKGKGTLL